MHSSYCLGYHAMPTTKAAAAAAVKVANAAARSAKQVVADAEAAKGKVTESLGFNKVLPVSPTLKKFLGVGEISRSDSMKRLWSYVRENKLQNPQKRREIVCDEKLKLVLGKDTVDFLEVAGLLNAHFHKKESKE